MIPYFVLTKNVHHALFVSIGITVVILLAFGAVKAKLTGTSNKDAAFSAIQTLAVGSAAAGTAYGIVVAVNNSKFG